jgi:hypothetical protein
MIYLILKYSSDDNCSWICNENGYYPYKYTLNEEEAKKLCGNGGPYGNKWDEYKYEKIEAINLESDIKYKINEVAQLLENEIFRWQALSNKCSDFQGKCMALGKCMGIEYAFNFFKKTFNLKSK